MFWRRRKSTIPELLAQMERRIMASLADVKAAIAQQTTVEASVATLLGNLSQQVAQLKTAGGATPEQLQNLIDDINGNTKALSDAVVANTAAPGPQPAIPPAQ
jgi:hypothetical protein